MSLERAFDGIRAAEIAVTALQVIQGLTRIGGATGVAAIGSIQAVLKTVSDGFEGKTTSDQVMAELTALKNQMAANDASVDDALKHRFDHSDVGGTD